MLEYLKKIFFPAENDSSTVSDEVRLQVATCALFIEMAKADGNFTNEEKEKIISIMKSFFNLEEEYVNELIEYAEEDIKESISLYEFTTILDSTLTRDQKYEIMKNMYRLIYLDEKLDMYEDQLVKRIGGMLNLDFQDIIAAKLEVKKENNL
jgi:uncharacterized tellurite resistance protein B-like protein